ncbi:putative sodium-glucose/galactose cotransporter [Clostridium scatologenes]|uniref:Putative sodium-glucose/galactose cotransporter n=1 Tax=Clostridium scatologenes TaxID=1548 RepID=A0A0E3JNP8_CLOSL|nr:putative sodium-glucose/galactose cotransporter [Clostridium scatologenes]
MFCTFSEEKGIDMNMKEISKIHRMFLAIFFIVFVWSAIYPKDSFTWFLEVLPAVIGITVIIFTYKKFRFTTFVYGLIVIHAIILLIGGHYTYAEMPLFNWIKDTFHLSRNYYDRLGHFAQGFIPAFISREILIRKSYLKKGKMLLFIVICICLAISAAYELIEWLVAEATGSAADAFLGTQGDVWDTQWDMFLALIGSCQLYLCFLKFMINV